MTSESPIDPLFWLRSETPDNDPESHFFTNNLRMPSLLMAVTAAAAVIFQRPIFDHLFIGAVTFFVTRLVKKLCDSYTFMQFLEKLGIKLIRTIPYFHVCAMLITITFSWYLPMVVLGVVSGLTHDVEEMRARYEQTV